MGDHRRHLQPDGLRRRRLPQLRARPPRTARPRDLHRLAVQDLRHARLARRLHGRPESVAKAVVTMNSNHTTNLDRKSVVKGKSGSIRLDLGGQRIMKKKTRYTTEIHKN